MIYQLYKTCDGQDGAMTTKDNGSTVSFIFDPANTDYQEYLKWVAEGGVALSADEPASQPADE